MTLSYPKRLIEVDLPIRAISEQARGEKSIRHGHISTLHIWWARRPLAACRAVICAALWPDPVDDLCPQPFREVATLALSYFATQVRSDPAVAAICGKHAQERWFRLTPAVLDPRNVASQFDIRYALLDFIADFSNWDASTLPAFLEPARLLTQVAYLSLSNAKWKMPVHWDRRDSSEGMRFAIKSLQDELKDMPRPLVVDPFAGGGAIPLESLRVGADAFASDLNPVAVLLNKVALEYIPKYGNVRINSKSADGTPIIFNGLAEGVRYWGNWVKHEAEKELGEFYPKDPDGATPIAYLWARTIRCEGPGCGAEVPLLKSLWLAQNGEKQVALIINRDLLHKKISFDIIQKISKKWVRMSDGKEIPQKPEFEGTIGRGSVTCPICGYTTPVEQVRIQLRKTNGGTDNSILFSIVLTYEGKQGRFYRLPKSSDIELLNDVKERLSLLSAKTHKGISDLPNEELPPIGTLGFRIQNYGMKTWSDLFSSRQKLMLSTLVSQINKIKKTLSNEKDEELVKAIISILACAIDREAEHSSSLCRWNPSGQKIQATFGRQALPMTWDFAETNPFGGSVGSWESLLDVVLIPFETVNSISWSANVEMTSATYHPLPDDSANAFITDPPYYDAVPYADLSDFFYVWMKRTIGDLFPDLFSGELTPKKDECIVDEIKGKNKNYFETNMTLALKEGRRILTPDGIGLVVFAHKSTSGWEAQLQAMIDAGWMITGSWPIDTEMGTRLRAMESAALASSIHLVCRPRETEKGDLLVTIGDWRDVLAELPGRIRDWLPRLAHEGVVGADAIFACLGPALEIYSRYSRVEKASGETVTLKEYLEHVWAAVSREALNMIFEGADATGFEEDARLTAMWLWTLKTEASATAQANGTAQFSIDEGIVDNDEMNIKGVKTVGFELEYDAARKIAQGLGAHLERLDGLVHINGDKARLLGLSDRAKSLFGKEDDLLSNRRKKKIDSQMTLFRVLDEAEAQAGDWGEKNTPKLGETTLDRLHQVMLLFASGRNEAIKRFLVDEGVGKDNRFWRLAQALSALYPFGTDEKRWVDGVLAKKKGLGF